MEFNNKAKKYRRARHTLLTVALITGGTLLGALVATAKAGNAPAASIAKPPCVMQPTCPVPAAASEVQASVPIMPTLDTLALHAALQNSSVFGLLRVLHEPDPVSEPQHKWCKN